MRVLCCLAPVCLFCFVPAAGRTQTVASSSSNSSTAEVSPSTATSAVNAPATSKTYSNEILHLRYSYPASFTDASAVVATAFKASVEESPIGGKDTARCVTLPFSVMSTAGGQLAIVLLMRADAACFKRTFTREQLPEFTQGEVRGLAASGAKPQFGETVDFTLGGHPAEQLRGSFALPTGDSMHAMVTCILLKPDIVCLQFLGNNDESLRSMSAFPLSLDNSAPVTLVPPAIGKTP